MLLWDNSSFLGPGPNEQPIERSQLGRVGVRAKPALPWLIDALADTDKTVRSSAADSLAKIDPEGHTVVPHLIATLRDDDGHTRSSAVNSLAILAKKALPAIPALIEALNDRDNEFYVRSGAADALGYMGPDSRVAIPDLARALRAEHPWIRNAAGRALASIDPLPDATPDQIEALIDMHVRTAPPRTSADEPDPATLARLGKALRSDDRNTRTQAGELLEDLGIAALPPLQGALQDANEDVRIEAARRLESLGYRADPLFPPSSKQSVATPIARARR